MLILYIVLAIAALLLLLAAIAPKNYNVSRSIEIKRPKGVVFEYLKFLKNQDEWSPWAKRDPNMEKKFTGTDGEVGALIIGKVINRWAKGSRRLPKSLKVNVLKVNLGF